MGGLVTVISPPLNATFAPTIAIAAKAAKDNVGNAFQLVVPTRTKSGNNGPIGIVQSARLTDLDGLSPRIALQIYKVAITDAGDGNTHTPSPLPRDYVGTVLVNPTDWLVINGIGYATVSAYGMASVIEGGIWYGQLVAVDGWSVATVDSIQGAISGIVT